MPDRNEWNAKIIEEFRANGGKVAGAFAGTSLLLLHTTGARSGQPRVNPLAYQPVGDAFAVFGSKAGASTHPDWYHNLLAHPDATVEVGEATIPVVARVAEGEEHDRIWEQQKRTTPAFAEYEAKTSRRIPVIILERAS